MQHRYVLLLINLLIIMSKGTKLTDFEKGQIAALKNSHKCVSEIARQLRRLRTVVSNFLNDQDNYGTKKLPGKKSITTPCQKRRIINIASNYTVGLHRIKKCFS